MKRSEYKVFLIVNEIIITKIMIDPHYEKKHKNSINDALIVELVKTLNGKEFRHITEDPPYKYFALDKIILNKKFYKLIWILEENENYIGVINAYRR